MTKTELIDALANRQNLPRATAEAIVCAVVDEMQDALLRGDRIEIRGFGSFSVREYAGYTGRNPRTLEMVSVAAKRLPVFKASRLMASRLNAMLKG